LHILMIAPEQFPLPGSGSVEICILSIAKEIAAHHQVTILCRRHPNQSNTSQIGNIKIVRLPAKGPKRYISAVLRYIKGKTFDIIQVDNRPGYAAKVKKAKPHTPVALFLHSLTFVPHTSTVASQLPKADLIIANSASVKNHLLRRFPRIKGKVRRVYLGVDTDRFKPPHAEARAAMRRKYSVTKKFLVLFTGRLVPRKGVPVLIEAAKKASKTIPNLRLLIVGGGKNAYVRSLKRKAKGKGRIATFVGKIPHQRIHQIYHAADCFVCPSQKHEGFGLVNIEAMSSGLPVIASNIGGIKEIIHHGKNGYLVRNYRSPSGFAKYITKIYTNKAKAKRIAMEGRRTVLQRFRWNNTAQHLLAIYSGQGQ